MPGTISLNRMTFTRMTHKTCKSWNKLDEGIWFTLKTITFGEIINLNTLNPHIVKYDTKQ